MEREQKLIGILSFSSFSTPLDGATVTVFTPLWLSTYSCLFLHVKLGYWEKIHITFTTHHALIPISLTSDLQLLNTENITETIPVIPCNTRAMPASLLEGACGLSLRDFRPAHFWHRSKRDHPIADWLVLSAGRGQPGPCWTRYRAGQQRCMCAPRRALEGVKVSHMKASNAPHTTLL